MSNKNYKNTGKLGIFDAEFAKNDLSDLGNPLEKMSALMNFDMFRETLESSLLKTNQKSNAGAKPYDVVLLFNILIWQTYYGLSDQQVEYQIIDSTSFKTFLGLSTGDKVPDEKTIWLFRETLTKKGLIKKLCIEFRTYLEQKALIFNEGKIVEASFAIDPGQRNTRAENALIKSGKGDDLWNDNKPKKSPKDLAARWTKKNEETFFGYKNHSKVDTKSKLITKYDLTDASVHDSPALTNLLDEPENAGQPFYGDSAYTGEKQEEVIKMRK